MIILIFILGVIGGVGLGFLIAFLLIDSHSKKNVEYKKEKDNYVDQIDNNIPKSIKDYYKKNK